MFQAFKRAKFLAKNNYRNVYTNDLASMYHWLMANGWPADKFLDLFMRCHIDFDAYSDGPRFKTYMESQYMWVHYDDVESLYWLYKSINTPRYCSVDKDGLVAWVQIMAEGAKNRP